MPGFGFFVFSSTTIVLLPRKDEIGKNDIFAGNIISYAIFGLCYVLQTPVEQIRRHNFAFLSFKEKRLKKESVVADRFFQY